MKKNNFLADSYYSPLKPPGQIIVSLAAIEIV